jgi:hypothetical protein
MVKDNASPFLRRYATVLKREMEIAIKESVLAVQGSIRATILRKKLKDTGTLSNSIQTQVLRAPGEMLGVIGTGIEYALPMELGIQKRFFPSAAMIEALSKWSRRKLGIAASDADRVGRAVAWKIARQGLDPRRFPSKFFEEGSKDGFKLVRKIMAARFANVERQMG